MSSPGEPRALIDAVTKYAKEFTRLEACTAEEKQYRKDGWCRACEAHQNSAQYKQGEAMTRTYPPVFRNGVEYWHNGCSLWLVDCTECAAVAEGRERRRNRVLWAKRETRKAHDALMSAAAALDAERNGGPA